MANTNDPVPTPRYAAIIRAASQLARDWGHQYVGAEHLFLATIGDRDAVPTVVLGELVDVSRVEDRIKAVMGSKGYATPTQNMMPRQE